MGEIEDEKYNGGFSLVELIIVIAIMAVLAGALAPMLINYIQKSRDSKAMTNARNFETAVEASLIDASEGTLGSDAREMHRDSVCNICQVMRLPQILMIHTHSLIASIYNSFDPKGQGFEAIAVVDTGRFSRLHTRISRRARCMYIMLMIPRNMVQGPRLVRRESGLDMIRTEATAG
ncbi:MAG: type II secretion system protein [Coprococcus sp.]